MFLFLVLYLRERLSPERRSPMKKVVSGMNKLQRKQKLIDI